MIQATEIPRGRRIRIEMDEEDAQALREILHKVGGSPDGHRGRMDKLREQLCSLGITRLNTSSGATYIE